MKIGIIGAGTWGIALCNLLVYNGHKCNVWVHSEINKNELQNNKQLKTLPGIRISDDVLFSCDFKEVLNNVNIVIIAVASPYVRTCVRNMKKYLNSNMIIVSVSKGIESETLFTMSEVIKDEIKDTNFDNIKIVVLSGPTHAEEVALKMPSMIVSSSVDENASKIVQDIFMNEYFRVYTNSDIKGVEICAAFKNIYALACGISTGIGFGDNTKAAIITRGLKEMTRLGEAIDCKKDTFYGLAGIGDLIVTCMSVHSRNNTCGKYIGEGLSVSQAIEKIGMVVEGINCLPASMNYINKFSLDMPICIGVNSIINENKMPKDIMTKLMLRDKKSE